MPSQGGQNLSARASRCESEVHPLPGGKGGVSPIARTSSCACVAGDCAGAYLTGTQAPNQVLALWPPIWRQHLLRGARASPGRLGTRDPAYPVHAAPKELTSRRRAAGAFVTGATAADQVRSPGAAPWDAARGARAPPGRLGTRDPAYSVHAAPEKLARRRPCTRATAADQEEVRTHRPTREGSGCGHARS